MGWLKPAKKLYQDKTPRWSSHEYAGFYNTYAWRKLSLRFRKEHPLCKHCIERKITTPSQEVDHIKSVKEYPELRMEWNNLQALCRRCHRSKESKERWNKIIR